jgi:hypothetical protein
MRESLTLLVEFLPPTGQTKKVARLLNSPLMHHIDRAAYLIDQSAELLFDPDANVDFVVITPRELIDDICRMCQLLHISIESRMYNDNIDVLKRSLKQATSEWCSDDDYDWEGRLRCPVSYCYASNTTRDHDDLELGYEKEDEYSSSLPFSVLSDTSYPWPPSNSISPSDTSPESNALLKIDLVRTFAIALSEEFIEPPSDNIRDMTDLLLKTRNKIERDRKRRNEILSRDRHAVTAPSIPTSKSFNFQLRPLSTISLTSTTSIPLPLSSPQATPASVRSPSSSEPEQTVDIQSKTG